MVHSTVSTDRIVLVLITGIQTNDHQLSVRSACSHRITIPNQRNSPFESLIGVTVCLPPVIACSISAFFEYWNDRKPGRDRHQFAYDRLGSVPFFFPPSAEIIGHFLYALDRIDPVGY